MFSTMIDFADVLLAALLVGAMFGIWLDLQSGRTGRVVSTSRCSSKASGR